MHEATRDLLEAALDGRRPDAAAARALAAEDDLAPLLDCAAALRDRVHPDVVTYSRKVFIPLTHLCRDVCHYCTFARPPRRGEAAFMTPDEVLRVAEAGAASGCKEALFTLGDKPELRYRAAREGLEELGYESTLAYLADDGEAGAGKDTRCCRISIRACSAAKTCGRCAKSRHRRA